MCRSPGKSSLPSAANQQGPAVQSPTGHFSGCEIGNGSAAAATCCVRGRPLGSGLRRCSLHFGLGSGSGSTVRGASSTSAWGSGSGSTSAGAACASAGLGFRLNGGRCDLLIRCSAASGVQSKRRFSFVWRCRRFDFRRSLLNRRGFLIGGRIKRRREARLQGPARSCFRRAAAATCFRHPQAPA